MQVKEGGEGLGQGVRTLSRDLAQFVDDLRSADVPKARGKLALHYAGLHYQEDRMRGLRRGWPGGEGVLAHDRVRVEMLSPGQYLAVDRIAGRVTYNWLLQATAGQGGNCMDWRRDVTGAVLRFAVVVPAGERRGYCCEASAAAGGAGWVPCAAPGNG